MKRLAPDLFDRRFSDLMEMGRARLPGLAPEWTDYNAHDPGITLMELLAWVTEAQLYALGRMRRDERAAYAALFGLAGRGTEPARGLLWPDRLDPHGPAAAIAQSMVIGADTVVNLVDAETPTFRPAAKLLWVPGRVERLAARLADGRTVDYTALNARGATPFQPFGTAAGPGDVLLIEFACRGDDGIFPAKRADAHGALWPIGIRADRPLAGGGPAPAALFAPAEATQGPALAVTLVTPGERIPLRVAWDTSAGLLRTGVLLLDLSALPGSPRRFTLELRAARGFERPPRLLRIEPNVLPIVQGFMVEDEVHVASGLPDWTFQLDVPGLRFAPFEAPLTVALRNPDSGQRSAWRPGRLADSGPQDAVYAFDAATQRVTFGNGVNGSIPREGATMVATYAVSDGEQGGAAVNHRWRVGGVAGTFGVNVDAVTGGAAPAGWIDERREARRRAREDHALVSSDDIVAAALALPLLEVARAWVLPATANAPHTGAVTLVALRARTSEADAGGTPETPRWLEGIRRRLAPRIPLATRLVVTAPRYIGFSIRATIEVAAGRDPVAVLADVERALGTRLALTGPGARRPGVPVTRRDLMAWIRVVEGVRRVATLRLLPASGAEVDEIAVPRDGLPRFDLAASVFAVHRPGAAP